MFENESQEEKGEQLDNSRPFDVHMWSDYPEAKKATQYIFDEILSEDGSRKRIHENFKKHLRVVLIDLFHNYLMNPEGYIGIGLGSGDYIAESRYNELYLSIRSMRRAIEWLHRLEYIELHPSTLLEYRLNNQVSLYAHRFAQRVMFYRT